ncbi:DUF3658 domain-containing protein [Desulfosporosinus sp. PR]|uniref:DUF3658 domain-containing protein n=1 Tax=Candidatus Desulfosporosinus nitrosoreducens TaxID=3401928 RepID=UPI0027F6F3E7|nr:DUF3658 domain-containing protein [Desulfosporosinus sp. PR]MDQ7096481.1 DUF3658 domain-containing protein [Desulfosporosinus sp. PR]
MLEVVFNDSAKGAMKAAKNYNKENMMGSVMGYIGKKPSKKESEKRFEGEAIGGSSQDVVCIGFSLDIGDIVNEIDSKERKSEFIRVYGSVNFEESEIEQFFKSQREDFEKLLVTAKSGETIRVWRSNAPFSACAFAFLCDTLRNIDCKISMIFMPEYWKTSEDTIQSCTDWAELTPSQFYRFLPLEREVSNVEKRLQSRLWNDLKQENAPLRAIVNGKLISVPEDFYDHLIIKNIPDREFVMAQLMGTILGRYSLGVGDGWYALRIQKMIAENKLVIVGDKDKTHPYGKILRKAE